MGKERAEPHLAAGCTGMACVKRRFSADRTGIECVMLHFAADQTETVCVKPHLAAGQMGAACVKRHSTVNQAEADDRVGIETRVKKDDRTETNNRETRMKVLVKFAIAILNLIFSVIKLLPVQDKVTFISRQSNEKSEDMLLLEASLRKKSPHTELVFLCRMVEKGLLAKIGYCFHMLTQMYHIATSKAVILDTYCVCISVLTQRPSLLVVQMWHALGSLKKFGLSILGDGEGRDQSIADAFSMHKNYTYVLTSGEACAKHFGEAFGYDADHMAVMSLPRVDKLTDLLLREETIQKIYRKYPEFREKKVVVYAPTFRKGRDISQEISALADAFDANEYVFVLKRHPLMSVGMVNGIVDETFTTIEMIFAADYVICDYSAVVFEAAVVGKPLFFYTFDYDAYGVSRDFYIDYQAEMPGVISSDPIALANAVASEKYDLERVRAFGKKYVQNQHGCSDKLADFILSNI